MISNIFRDVYHKNVFLHLSLYMNPFLKHHFYLLFVVITKIFKLWNNDLLLWHSDWMEWWCYTSYSLFVVLFLDILFILFRLFSTLGLIGYTIFVITVSMTFCSCCIKSDKAKGITKFSVVVADLITCKFSRIQCKSTLD